MPARHGHRWILLGSSLMALGVGAGAFGAHLLEGRLEPRALEVYHTAVRYHLLHALGLVAVGLAAPRLPSRLTAIAGGLLAAGILLFSGSLYALALTGLRVLGALTPLGGLCFIAGWVCLGLAASLRGGGAAHPEEVAGPLPLHVPDPREPLQGSDDPLGSGR